LACGVRVVQPVGMRGGESPVAILHHLPQCCIVNPTDPLRQDGALISEIRRLQAERANAQKPERGVMRSIIGRVRG
jgi:hypothetical protein